MSEDWEGRVVWGAVLVLALFWASAFAAYCIAGAQR